MNLGVAGNLLDQEVVVCLGSGGVGKTTSAAAIAAAGALAGRKALVLTIDPARRLATALGLDTFGAECVQIDEAVWAQAGVQPKGELHAMMLDTQTAFTRMIKRYAPNASVGDRILGHPLYEQMSTALAGSHDYMALEQLYALQQEGRFDLLVLDTPPASHAVQFLEAPNRLVTGLNSVGSARFLHRITGDGGSGVLQATKGLVTRALSRFTGKGLLKDVAELLLAFGEMAAGFGERAEVVEGWMASPACSFLIVAAPRSFSIAEALHLRRRLDERGLPHAGYIVNRVHPNPGSPQGKEVSKDSLANAIEDALTTPTDPTQVDALAIALMEAYEAERNFARRDAKALEVMRSEEAPLLFVEELEDDVHSLGTLIEVGNMLGLSPEDQR